MSHRRRFMIFIMNLVSSIWINTFSFSTLSVQLIFFNHLKYHISKVSMDLFSVSLITHVSHPYKDTLFIKVFKKFLFTVVLLIFFEIKIYLFFLDETSFCLSDYSFDFLRTFPSFVIGLPKYLKLET